MAVLRQRACNACAFLCLCMFPIYSAMKVQTQSQRMVDMAAAPNVQDPPQQQQVVSSASFAAHPQAKALGTMHRPALQMNLPAQDLDVFEEQYYKTAYVLPALDGQPDGSMLVEDVSSWSTNGQLNNEPSGSNPSYHVTVQTITDTSGNPAGSMVQVESFERCGNKYAACHRISSTLGSYGLDLDWRQSDALKLVESVTEQMDQQLLSVEDIFNNVLAEATEGMLQLENLAFGGLSAWQDRFMGSMLARGRKLKQDKGYDILQLLTSRL